MRQRVMIAIGLACNPQLLIADEPTTALDVTIQAQIVDLVKELRDKLGMSVVWITHDLALIAGLADRIAVLYAGTVVEDAPVDALFANPSASLHPAACSPRSRSSPTSRTARLQLDRRHAAGAGPPPAGLSLRAALSAGGARSATSASRRWKAAGEAGAPPRRLLRRRNENGGRVMGAQPLMRIENLVKHFHVRLGAFGERAATVHALDDVNFDILEGETLSLVGEVRLRQVDHRLHASSTCTRPTGGKVIYQGRNIVELDEKAMRPYPPRSCRSSSRTPIRRSTRA